MRKYFSNSILAFAVLAISLGACGSKTAHNTQPDSNTTTAPISTASVLPDRIHCSLEHSTFDLILILKDAKLPDGLTAVALKHDDEVIFKIATQLFTDQAETLSFSEIPATVNSKVIKLNLQTKVANVKNFSIADRNDSTDFNCQF